MIGRFAFTRAYQVRHGNALEYDFLYGLAAHLEQRDSLVLVGSGPRGIGPLGAAMNMALAAVRAKSPACPA